VIQQDPYSNRTAVKRGGGGEEEEETMAYPSHTKTEVDKSTYHAVRSNISTENSIFGSQIEHRDLV